MNHEPLAAGVFNSTYNGASSQLSMWDGHLDNSVEVLELMCERMEKDWLNLNPKFRKSYGFKELATGLRLDMLFCKSKFYVSRGVVVLVRAGSFLVAARGC